MYVPGANYVPSQVSRSGSMYKRYREVRAHPVVNFSRTTKIRSQGYSTGFANQLAKTFRQHNIRVHPHNPVRDSIVRRKGKAWVPAVLRNNVIPTKILLETCNLNNAQDAALMKDAGYRQRLAEAIVAALDEFYSRK